MAFWLVKSEPDVFSWETFLLESGTIWDGVRNYQARNYLAQMQLGDLVLFYHSRKQKAVVGLAHVVETAFPDPSALIGEKWVAVKLNPVKALAKPISLEDIKKEPDLKNILLLKQSRLSVMPLQQGEFDCILSMSEK